MLRECYRTLKPGGTIRLVLPDVSLAVQQYLDCSSQRDNVDVTGLMKLSRVAQCYGHQSLWDANIMLKVLEELGYVNGVILSYGKSTLDWLAVDREERKSESFYVEAVKP